MKLDFIPNENMIAVDPSGNGTTGLACNIGVNVFLSELSIKDFSDQHSYFRAIITEIENVPHFDTVKAIVIEDFILYKNTARSLTNQKMHTSELIGLLKYEFIEKGIEIIIEKATIHKNTVSDTYLKKHCSWQILEKASSHKKDALRMLIHNLKKRRNNV